MLSFVLALAALAPSAAHPNSVSSSRLIVDGAKVELVVRCQARTLLEACPELDRDHDEHLDARELADGSAVLEHYVGAHYTLAVDCGDTVASGTKLVAELATAALVQGRLDGATPGEALVDLSLHFTSTVAPKNLGIDTTLFRESDPWHRDRAEIVWNGAAPQARLLWVEDPQWLFVPDAAPRGGVFGEWILLGIGHIVNWEAYDHIAFLVALIVSARRLRSLLLVVTAFTLAHSLTLASAAFGVFTLRASIVEPAIALSIAWVGVRSVFAQPPARLWPEAFFFGLIHGLGFAGSVAAMLAEQPAKLQALVGFNLGVECGQLVIVLTVVGLLWLVRRKSVATADPAEIARVDVERISVEHADGELVGAGHAGVEREGVERAGVEHADIEQGAPLAPTWLRRIAAGVVAVLGLWWFVARVLG